MSISELIVKIWPIIVFQLALQAYALYDLFKYKQVKKYSVAVWAIIIIVGELLGPIVYFLLGKSEDEVSS